MTDKILIFFLSLCHIDVDFGGHSWSCFQRIGKRLKTCPIHPCKLLQKVSTDFLMIKVVANKFLSRNNVINKNKTLNHFADNAIMLTNNDAIRK